VLSQRLIRRTTDPVASEPMGARPETT